MTHTHKFWDPSMTHTDSVAGKWSFIFNNDLHSCTICSLSLVPVAYQNKEDLIITLLPAARPSSLALTREPLDQLEFKWLESQKPHVWCRHWLPSCGGTIAEPLQQSMVWTEGGFMPDNSFADRPLRCRGKIQQNETSAEKKIYS